MGVKLQKYVENLPKRRVLDRATHDSADQVGGARHEN